MAYELAAITFLYGLVSPNPTYGISGLPQAFVLFFNDMPFWKRSEFVNTFQYVVILPFGENTK